MSLRARAFRAMFWVAFAGHSARAVSYITQLLLAALLAPEAFGLVSLVFVVLRSMQIIQDMGLSQTLVARKDENPAVAIRAANAAFYMSAAAGLFLTILLCLVAPAVGLFFGSSEISPLLQVMSARLVIASLSTVPSALLQKDLRFKKLTWPKLAGAAGFAALSLPLAIAGFGPWSVVWAGILQAVLETASVWFIVRWRPGSGFDRKVAWELFGYSKHIVGISLGTFLQSNFDSLAVAKILGPAALGYYNLAFSLANAPSQIITGAAFPVLLPAYSEVQDQRARLANLHLRLIKYLMLVLAPICLIIAVLARPGILTIYGETWSASIVPLQLLAFYALIRSLAAAHGPLLLATQQARAFSRIVYASLALLVLLAYPALKLGGLTGMSLAMTASALLSAIQVLLVCRHNLGETAAGYLRFLAVPLAGAALASAAILVLRAVSPIEPTAFVRSFALANGALMVAQSAVFLVIYVIAVLTLDSEVRTTARQSWSQLVTAGSLRALIRD